MAHPGQHVLLDICVRMLAESLKLLLLPCGKRLIHIAHNWLVPGTDSRVINISRVARFTIDLNKIE